MAGKLGMKHGVNVRRSVFCYMCKQQKEKITRKYCKKCAANYMRAWRAKHPLNAVARAKLKLRRDTKMRIKNGLLIPYPCEICGKKEVEAHHEDYNKPYEVRWLCREHHRALHKTGIKKTSEGGL
ncbi:hypothetical protein [Aquicella siphonis]|uniref:hypothetical protein n=1 Tax=Aquicella siphonis TaxID=254247 RepID=UPI0018D6BAF4|nr:hypothetical protein [Aquicella siphonis]